MDFLSPAAAGMHIFAKGGPGAWAMIPADEGLAARRPLASSEWYVGVVNTAGDRYFMPASVVLAFNIARQPADRAWLEELIARGAAVPGDQLSRESFKATMNQLDSIGREVADLPGSPAARYVREVNPPVDVGVGKVAAWYGARLGDVAGVVGQVAGATAASVFVGLGPVGASVVVLAVGFMVYRLVMA
jgi:hypothetical protein